MDKVTRKKWNQGIGKRQLEERLARDFSVPQDRCEHDQKFNDPSQVGRIWKRCATCGLVLEERDRCPQVNPNGTRCLAVIADGYETCYAHSLERREARAETVDRFLKTFQS